MNGLRRKRRAFHGGQGLPRNAAGFVLPTAIFLMVIMAALAAYMVSLSRTSHISSALDIQGARAYQAARAGVEWAAWQVVDPQNLQLDPDPCPPSPSVVAAPGATALAGSLATFTVTVTCTRTLDIDGADQVAVYQVTSTATSGAVGSVDRVERQIQASFSR